ncbi:MAG: hypothetical protein Ct9H90mP19_4640 [Gammaproteobacteria bacterium]|nr:MAG: hypothetical protein Ct9H90mP19_4640 [Gammaproteobacteria bacterium]
MQERSNIASFKSSACSRSFCTRWQEAFQDAYFLYDKPLITLLQSHEEQLLSAFGAFLCISALAYINLQGENNLWLIPPFGASMVLVMAVHESPLAHPKNILFGHVLSALSGVLFFQF